MFRDHILACYITDPSGLLLRDRIGSTSSPGSATTPTPTPPGPSRPSSPGRSSRTLGCRDDEIHKITWENACRFFGWDPFTYTPKDEATVGALRSVARDVDVTRMSRDEWRTRNEAAGIGVVTTA